jgi:lipopolysaccharide export system protein LptA
MAQKKVKLERADKQVGGKLPDGQRYDSWIGDVVFSHLTTRIKCDSAIRINKTNVIEAFGHVHIKEGDSVTVTSKKLIYDGNTQKAKLRNDVVFSKLDQVTLYTDFLDYDRIKQQAYYYNTGKLVDSTNTLSSQKGYYQVNTNMASFKKNVVGVNPDYTLKSDTLQYNTTSNIIFFRAPTELTDIDGNIFNYSEGQYDTSQKKSALDKGVLETESYNLVGDKLFLDDIRRYYKATSNVVMTAKNDDIIISGEIGEYWRDQKLTKIYGNALMKQITDGDTLYLSADTLVSIDSDLDVEKRLLAYNNVKIFKNDLQGTSDSLSYDLADSTIYFYNDPVLWNDGNQLTADSINLKIADKKIKQLNMNVSSFVISQDTVQNFNQIKGRSMVAYFGDNAIDHILVNGNGESIYFALDEVDNSVMGMNKILCSDMKINFGENKLKDIIFYVQPEGKLIPPQELKENEKQLKGFIWRVEEKPTLLEMLARDIQVTTSNDNSVIDAPVLVPNLLDAEGTPPKILKEVPANKPRLKRKKPVKD